MSIRRHGPGWQVRLPGERAKTFPTKAAAEKWELHRKVARSLGDLHDEPTMPLSEALDGTLYRWQAKTQPAPGTVARAREAIAFLKRELGHIPLDQLGLVMCEDVFVARAAEHPNSAKKEQEWLKRTLRDAGRRGLRFSPALLELDPIKVVSRVGIALDLDELERLASWFPEHLALMPEILGSVGLRLGEALGLTDDRVDLRRGVLFIPASMNKERRDKLIELATSERTMLAEQLVARPAGTPLVFPRAGAAAGRRGGRPYPAGQWDPGDFYTRVWHPARKSASREWREDHQLPDWAITKFDSLVPHDLRHTAISLMAPRGCAQKRSPSGLVTKTAGSSSSTGTATSSPTSSRSTSSDMMATSVRGVSGSTRQRREAGDNRVVVDPHRRDRRHRGRCVHAHAAARRQPGRQ